MDWKLPSLHQCPGRPFIGRNSNCGRIVHCSIYPIQEFIKRLPKTDHPASFGQHVNADITSLIDDTNALLGTMVSCQPSALVQRLKCVSCVESVRTGRNSMIPSHHQGAPRMRCFHRGARRPSHKQPSRFLGGCVTQTSLAPKAAAEGGETDEQKISQQADLLSEQVPPTLKMKVNHS